MVAAEITAAITIGVKVLIEKSLRITSSTKKIPAIGALKTDASHAAAPQPRRVAVFCGSVLSSRPTIEPIVVTDPLAPGLQLVSTSGAGWTCTGTTTVRCTYDAAVAAGGNTPELRIETRLVGSPGSTVTNVATVDGGESEDKGAENRA